MSGRLLGEIVLFAGRSAPRGWALCDGQILEVDDHPRLFGRIGETFGGDGRTTFTLPDFRGRVPLHSGQGSGLSPYKMGDKGGSESVALRTAELPAHNHPVQATSGAGCSKEPQGHILAQSSAWDVYRPNVPGDDMHPGAIAAAGEGEPHDNMLPFLCLNFIIAMRDGGSNGQAKDKGSPWGAVEMVAGNQVPDGYVPCDGRLLPVSRHRELFESISTTYGGDGVENFAVPDLRGRAALHAGQALGLSPRRLGACGGSAKIVLKTPNLPSHTHTLVGTHCPAKTGNPRGNTLAQAGYQSRDAELAEMAPEAIAETGEGRPHDNMQPYLVLLFIIRTRA